MCEISQLRRQKQRQAAAACSSGFRSELPAIIPLVLGGLPNKIPPSYPKGAPGQTAAHNVRPIPWKRRVRIARYSHQQVQLLLLSLGAQSRPVAVAVAVFVDTFFTACSLGCSFVRCHCQESHSESNQFRALASPRLASPRETRNLPNQTNRIVAPARGSCCLFSFWGAPPPPRPFWPENQNTPLGVRRTSAWNF